MTGALIEVEHERPDEAMEAMESEEFVGGSLQHENSPATDWKGNIGGGRGYREELAELDPCRFVSPRLESSGHFIDSEADDQFVPAIGLGAMDGCLDFEADLRVAGECLIYGRLRQRILLPKNSEFSEIPCQQTLLAVLRQTDS